MPKLEVTREELEDLIQSVMLLRCDLSVEPEMGQRLINLHVKLEETLELWINGGLVEVPIPPHLQGIGIAAIHIEHPPHDEGVTRGD